MDFVFIVNPVSGNGASLKAIKIIEEYCKIIGIQYNIFYTSKKEEAKKIAKIIGKCPNRTIFSVGGDGTLNEVINGLAYSKSNLGIIPAGTGNDFYRTFESIDSNKIDLGRVNDRYFINVASLGLDAEIANYANTLKNSKLSSKSVYTLGIIHEYFLYKPIDIKIGNDIKSTTILTVLFCNSDNLTTSPLYYMKK